MNAAFRISDLQAQSRAVELGTLPLRDRAVLRLLYRMEAATAQQLTDLAYRRPRKAQHRLQKLWRLRLTERTRIATDHAGAPPYAHRLTHQLRRRLGYRTPRPRITAHLRHLLDSHDVVCALACSTSAAPTGPVQAWLTAPMAARVLRRVEPDGIVVLHVEQRSAVVCIELDEGTEHHPIILDKLERYAVQIGDRTGWHLLLVVPSTDRLVRVRQLAGRAGTAVPGHTWLTLLEDVRRYGLMAKAFAAGSVHDSIALRNLIDDPRDRRSGAPVGGDAWLSMLATGGVEDFDGLLAGRE